MNEALKDMAIRCYGYGRWDAPYWFIGPEQGQSSKENHDLEPRLKAWLGLGGRELDDCEEFSVAINEHSWHREGKLQSTWRPLILLLMTFINRPADKESLRTYQRHQWGRTTGETCVIELSGLAAKNLTVPSLSYRGSRSSWDSAVAGMPWPSGKTWCQTTVLLAAMRR
jgi:hypothetical protein